MVETIEDRTFAIRQTRNNMDGSADNLKIMEEMLGEVLKQASDGQSPHHYKPLKHEDNPSVPSEQSDPEQKSSEYNNDSNGGAKNESGIDNDELKALKSQDPSKHEVIVLPTTSNQSEFYLSTNNNRRKLSQSQPQKIELQAIPSYTKSEYAQNNVTNMMVGKYYEFEFGQQIINLRLKSVGDYEKDTTSDYIGLTSNGESQEIAIKRERTYTLEAIKEQDKIRRTERRKNTIQGIMPEC